MKLSIPPRIYWHIQGEVSDSDQKRIRAEARRQVGILNKGLGFQGLSQGRRRAKVGGLEFACTSVFGLESVHVSMAGGVLAPIEPSVRLKLCWCTYQLAEGTVLEVIPSGALECIPTFNIYYPSCAIDDLTQFQGQRYRVEICQCDISLKKNGKFNEYICIPPDFETYEIGDRVAVLYIEAWDIEAFQDPEESGFNSCTENECACNVEPRDKTADVIIDALDGDFLVLPYDIIESE